MDIMRVRKGTRTIQHSKTGKYERQYKWFNGVDYVFLSINKYWHVVKL